ncbi:hypothetical protein FRC15_008551, partial [Serendipita sp. 397]
MTSSSTDTKEKLHSFLSGLPEFASTPRIQSLYSDLGRQKLSNPSGYTANLGWWRSVLQELVSRRMQSNNANALVLHVNQELSDALRWDKVGRPAGLSTVVDDMTRDGDLHPLGLFLLSSVSIYESGSVVGRVADILIKRSFWWAMEHLNLVNPDGSESAAAKWKRVCGDYVVISVVKTLADSIIAAQDEKSSLTISETIYSLDSFKKYAESCSPTHSIRLSDLDVKILLRYLSRDRHVLVVQGEVIKFAEDPALRRITSIDQGVFELKSTIERVEQQIEHIETSIKSRTNQIKAAVLASRKEIAKLQLSSRKALEALLNQRVQTLTTLTAALSSIDQAHSDAAILKAYETSSKVLKEILSKPELQKERVDEVMDKLREGMEGAEEIRIAVEEGGWEVVEAAGAGVDEDELQKELEVIIQQEKQQEAAIKVPTISQDSKMDEKKLLEITRRLESQHLKAPHKAVVSATTASLLSTFAGYPLDSLKSRLQASRTSITVPRLAANILREEGIAGFYRGIWIPLVTISAVRAVSFTIYNETKDKLHGPYGWSRERLLSVGASGAVGGALAGCLISIGSVRECDFHVSKDVVLTSPQAFELVKVRRQLEYSIAAAKGIQIVKPPSTWSAIKDIVRGANGDKMGGTGNSPKGITALWTGMRLHWLRDTSGTALYFFEYDSMRYLLGRLPNGEQGPTPYWAPIHASIIPFVCGSLAGVSSWAIIYPLDVVKTKTQQRALSGLKY